MNWWAVCVAAAVVAGCQNHSKPAAAGTKTLPPPSDSAAGEVAQYALMKNNIGWLTDSNIVSLASMVNQGPIALARVEAQSWTNENIHTYALQVLREHVALQATLDSLSAKRRIPGQRPAVADEMQPQYDSAAAVLTGLTLEQMEPKFLDAMIAMHTRTVTDFAALAGNANDPDLRSVLANRALAMEQAHVARAKLVAASLVAADSIKKAKEDSAKATSRKTRRP